MNTFDFNEPRPCTLCKFIKKADEFTPRNLISGNKSRMSRCRSCCAFKSGEARKRISPEARLLRNEALKEYHKSRPEKTKKGWHKSNITRRFSKMGLTIELYQEMFELQKGCCAICFNPEMEFANDGEIKRLAVDHCHIENKIRGLLCSKCNKALGSFRDSEEIIKNALNYIRKSNET
jgi:hypothetical protein